jgi:hypothetical protein
VPTVLPDALDDPVALGLSEGVDLDILAGAREPGQHPAVAERAQSGVA